jgi:uncharacterized protein YcfJ
MIDYAIYIRQIRQAESLEEIRDIARQFSAKAEGEGGILYSRPVGSVSSERIALEFAERTGVPIINKTPRAEFLSDGNVHLAIKSSAERILQAQGHTAEMAKRLAMDFQYGDPKAAANSLTSLDGCLWGDASREFAASLRGDVKVVATAANMDRVFGKVELPAVLANPNVKTLGGQPLAHLRDIAAKDGLQALLDPVQSQFVEAAPRGIYKTPGALHSVAAPVTLSREFAGAMGVDASKFVPASDLSASGAVVRADIGMAVQVARDDAVIASRTVPKELSQALGASPLDGRGGVAEASAARNLHPGLAGKSLGALGAAATVYDLGDTTHDVSRLRGQGNATAAEDRITRFATQNVGGWGGAGLGGMAGGAVGNLPGAVLGTAVGGIAGAVAGDKVADWLRDHKINHQQDGQGHTWTFDPDRPAQGWTRTERTLDMEAMSHAATEFPIYRTLTLSADPALSDRLTYQASCQSIELALGAPPAGRDPYRLPVAATDASERLAFEVGRAWIRDPRTEQWQQAIDLRIDGRIPTTQVVPATPSQAAALERQSQAILAQNAQHTPAAMATQFQAVYERNGWSQYGPMPAAVTDALRHPGRVVGSDGQIYERDAQGQWTHDALLWDSQAAGNLRHELEGTYRRQPGPAHAAEPMAVAPRQAQASESAPQVAAVVSAKGSTPGRSEAAQQPHALPGRLDDPHHPDHAFYLKTRELVRQLDQQNGRTPDHRSDQLASALTVAARTAGLQRIDQVALGEDASALWGAQRPPGARDHFFDRQCKVDTMQALNMPMEQSGVQWPQAMQAFREQQAQAQQQAQSLEQVAQQAAATMRR